MTNSIGFLCSILLLVALICFTDAQWNDERWNGKISNDERSNNERWNNERSNNERWNNERSNNDRWNNERSNNDRWNNERSNNERWNNERSNNERSNNERWNNERSDDNRGNGERQNYENRNNERRNDENRNNERRNDENRSNERRNYGNRNNQNMNDGNRNNGNRNDENRNDGNRNNENRNNGNRNNESRNDGNRNNERRNDGNRNNENRNDGNRNNERRNDENRSNERRNDGNRNNENRNDGNRNNENRNNENRNDANRNNERSGDGRNKENRAQSSADKCPADNMEDWSYRGNNGVQMWSRRYPECGGRSQSPVAINSYEVILDENREKLKFNNYQNPLERARIENDGHTIQITPRDSVQRTIQLDGTTYRLGEVHFHWGDDKSHGSEHTIDLFRYPLEMHLVHQNGRRTAVVAVFFREQSQASKELQNIVQAFPKLMYKDNSTELKSAINLNNLLPANPASYYWYEGSLTTPPCTEGVQWLLLPKVMPVGTRQMAEFRKLYSSAKRDSNEYCKLSNNYRPLQPLNRRRVIISQ